MRGPVFLCASFGLSAFSLFAQVRIVAITVDDLPYAGGALAGTNADTSPPAERVNRLLLAAFHAHHVPATGFVIQQNVEALGTKFGPGILREWIREGFDLGITPTPTRTSTFSPRSRSNRR